MATLRFKGAVRGQSGHLPRGTGPKRGHRDCGAEAELDAISTAGRNQSRLAGEEGGERRARGNGRQQSGAGHEHGSSGSLKIDNVDVDK